MERRREYKIGKVGKRRQRNTMMHSKHGDDMMYETAIRL